MPGKPLPFDRETLESMVRDFDAGGTYLHYEGKREQAKDYHAGLTLMGQGAACVDISRAIQALLNRGFDSE